MLARSLLTLWVLLLPAQGVAQDYAAIDNRLQRGDAGPVTSLVVQRRGAVVHEAYFRGANADELQLLNSATKSVGATLVGIAVRQARLAAGDRLPLLLPAYDWNSASLRDKRGLELRHVLQMRHGLAWDEFSTSFLDPRNPVVGMLASDDYYLYTLRSPVVAAPGARFDYSTGVSTLMSGVLRNATGLTPQQYAERYLFAPLGITAAHWETWSPGGRGTGVRSFPFGDAPLGIGLWLRPRDLARIGQLYLDGGVHAGQRLLDPEWIRDAWTVYSDARTDAYFVETVDEGFGYGYQWWYRAMRDARGRAHPVWYASGYGGQRLYVFPQLELVVASTADSTVDYSGPGIATVLRELLLPALQVPVTPALSGSYYDPARSGQGLNIEVLGNGAVVAYWYTYAAGGQRWYVMQGDVAGDRVALTVYRTEGGVFLDPAPATLVRAGTAQLRWDTCATARLDYDIEAGRGTYPLTRLTGSCSAIGAAAPR